MMSKSKPSTAPFLWLMGLRGPKERQLCAEKVGSSSAGEAEVVAHWEGKVVFLGNCTLFKNILYSVVFLVTLYLFMTDLKEWKNNI